MNLYAQNYKGALVLLSNYVAAQPSYKYVLRGCCCCNWGLASVSYTIDGDPSECHANITLPDPDHTPCVYADLQDFAYTIIHDKIEIWIAPWSCDFEPRKYIFPDSVTENGDHGSATAHLVVPQGDGIPSVTYNFEVNFIRKTSDPWM